MNIVSSIFQNPDSPADRKAVDLLEGAFPEQVRRIRETRNWERARNLAWQLHDELEKASSLTEAQTGRLRGWLDALCSAIPPSEQAGLHFSGEQ